MAELTWTSPHCPHVKMPRYVKLVLNTVDIVDCASTQGMRPYVDSPQCPHTTEAMQPAWTSPHDPQPGWIRLEGEGVGPTAMGLL
jgi:hypothetical protein